MKSNRFPYLFFAFVYARENSVYNINVGIKDNGSLFSKEQIEK